MTQTVKSQKRKAEMRVFHRAETICIYMQIYMHLSLSSTSPSIPIDLPFSSSTQPTISRRLVSQLMLIDQEMGFLLGFFQAP